MPVGAYGISCDTCRPYASGICHSCFVGTDERVQCKLDAQMKEIKMYCPILACAVENKVGYCMKDCSEFPCKVYESGFEKLMRDGPYPYSGSFLTMFRR